MTVTIPGYGTLHGSPKTILRLMQDSRLLTDVDAQSQEKAEKLLRFLEGKDVLTIEKEVPA